MEPLPPAQESEPQAQMELPQEFDPVDPTQEAEPQALVEHPKQESESQTLAKLPQSQEFDQSPVDSPQESPPRPTIVCLDTAAKTAHKLLEQWYKDSGKHTNDEDNEATGHHSGPPRLGLGEMSKEPLEDEDGFESFDPFYGLGNLGGRMAEFDPSDLSQYSGRYVAATSPTEPEPWNVTENYVIVKTYKSDSDG